MKRFVEVVLPGSRQRYSRSVVTENWIDGDNPVRVIDAFVESSTY